jgi:hypothetical protein
MVVEMAMKPIAGPRQGAASSTGNVAIERLHHPEHELPHVVAPTRCSVNGQFAPHYFIAITCATS